MFQQKSCFVRMLVNLQSSSATPTVQETTMKNPIFILFRLHHKGSYQFIPIYYNSFASNKISSILGRVVSICTPFPNDIIIEFKGINSTANGTLHSHHSIRSCRRPKPIIVGNINNYHLGIKGPLDSLASLAPRFFS